MKHAETDVVIVGAGLSGICAAYHLQTRCPGKRFRIIEARDSIGGTWDLFRYPGIRSDSDMYSFGFEFKPWTDPQVIAPAATIRKYLDEAVSENDLARHITFGTRVVAAEWSSDAARWRLQLESVSSGQRETLECTFLFSCGGYYRYDAGYTPEFRGIDRFAGRVIHPQHWPEDFECRGKRVAIIGSGATAITLAPTLAAAGAQVTLLQRSPTWIIARADRDGFSRALHKYLPGRLAHSINRWRNILVQMGFYQLSKRKPELVKRYLLAGAKRLVGDKVDVKKHFLPDYAPWDQRVCLIPNGDFFKAVRRGEITMKTDHIDQFDAAGVSLKSGERIDCDVVVTATGLVVQPFGGFDLAVDGQKVDVASRYVYRGMMLNDVPNAAVAVGYTNASWTLKTELIAKYVCRLLNYMERRQYDYCVPALPEGGISEAPLLDLQSGYIQRARGLLPRQGTKHPWKLYQNYVLDRFSLRWARLSDGTLKFGRQTNGDMAPAPLKESTT